MNLDAHLTRAQMLMSQNRHDIAESEIRKSLAQDPDNYLGSGMLAICLAEQEKYSEATDVAHRTIELAPDESYPHHVMAGVLVCRNRHREALASLHEAIRVNPYDDEIFATLASVHLCLQQWREALEAANQGLSIDPENTDCLNSKSIAQVKLGQSAEAEETIAAAMQNDPDDAFTHGSLGWSKLESGKHQEAMEHFREALRLEPDSEWARQGILESMRSRNFIYRLLLKYFLFMSKLTNGMQWVVIIGSFLLYRVIRSLATNVPELAPILWPILYLFIAFALFTWIAQPVMNLILRFNRFGRLVLTKEEIRTSNWIAAILVVTLGSLIIGLASGSIVLLIISIVVGAMLFPMSRLYSCEKGWPRNVGYAITGAMVLMGTSLLGLVFFGSALVTTEEQSVQLFLIGRTLMAAHLVTALISQFALNWLAMQKVRH